MMFVKYKNVAITREQLLRELWGVDFTGETRTINVHVGAATEEAWIFMM